MPFRVANVQDTGKLTIKILHLKPRQKTNIFCQCFILVTITTNVQQRVFLTAANSCRAESWKKFQRFQGRSGEQHCWHTEPHAMRTSSLTNCLILQLLYGQFQQKQFQLRSTADALWWHRRSFWNPEPSPETLLPQSLQNHWFHHSTTFPFGLSTQNTAALW